MNIKHQKDWLEIVKSLKTFNDKFTKQKNNKISKIDVNDENWDLVRSEFIKIWNIEKISEMELSDYSMIISDDYGEYSFTYWIETILSGLGNIKGSTSIKFGIYKSKKGIYEYKKSLLNSSYYVHTGNIENDIFQVIKKSIIDVIKFSQNGDLEFLENIWELSNMFKWKIAFLYNVNIESGIYKNSNYISRNEILPIYSYELLFNIYKIKINRDVPFSNFSTIYRELILFKENNKDLYLYSKELLKIYDTDIDESQHLINNLSNSILINYSNFDDTINDIIKKFNDHKRVICFFEKESTVNKIEIIQKNRIDFGYIIGKSLDGNNILYKIKILNGSIKPGNKILKKDLSYIPESFKDNYKSFYAFEIIKIKQVRLSEIDFFEAGNEKKVRDIQLLNGNLYLLKEKDFSKILNINLKEFEDFGVITKIKEIIGIKINEYQGIKDLDFINLSSNTEYYLGENKKLIKGKKKYNIFKEDNIENFNCILGKNGVGKSRIIRLILNYIHNWQSLDSKRDEGIFDIYFKDFYGNIIRVNNNDYIGKVEISSNNYHGLVLLDFSTLKNIYISNTPSDSLGLLYNNIIDGEYDYSKEFASYLYFGVMKNNQYSLRTTINNYNHILFSILSNGNLLNIFNDLLKEISIDFSFDKVFINPLNEKNNRLPLKLRGSKNLGDLFINILETENDNFFSRNINRSKLKDIFVKNGQSGIELIIDNLIVERVGVSRMAKIDKISDKSDYMNFFESIKLDKKINIPNFNDYINSNLKNNKGLSLKDKYIIIDKIYWLLFKSNLISLDIISHNNEVNLYLKDLSSGEIMIVTTIAKILYSLYQNYLFDVNLYFDEPDSFLHPEMQRKFIYAITTCINKFKEIYDNDKQVSIIMTTHSPIIVSDIPKSNIISLSKNKKGNISINSLNTETFLNNLLINYVNTFSVDAFIGEYSINKFKKNKKKKNFKSIIGDNFLEFILNKNEKN